MRLNETPTRLLAMVDSVRMLSLDDNRNSCLAGPAIKVLTVYTSGHHSCPSLRLTGKRIWVNDK